MAVTFKENIRQFTHITNTLAKDKEISDRWRGFADVADSRHLSNRVEPEVVEALVTAVRAAYPRLSHRYYALKAHWFGKKKLPHWDRNAPLPKVATRTISWTEAQATVLTAYGAFSTDMAAIAETILQEQLDRRAGAAGQVARRVLASDRAVGASVCAAQLPGQAARRDDARARARPRRAPGAGGAERPADGADAAHAGGDRERVRRDADVPQAPRRHHRPQAAQGHARRQGRGHDQHRGAADRVLHLRAQAPHRAPQGRADLRPHQRALDVGAAREPRPRDRAASPATRRSGPTSRTSCIRRSTSTPMPSATAS